MLRVRATRKYYSWLTLSPWPAAGTLGSRLLGRRLELVWAPRSPSRWGFIPSTLPPSLRAWYRDGIASQYRESHVVWRRGFSVRLIPYFIPPPLCHELGSLAEEGCLRQFWEWVFAEGCLLEERAGSFRSVWADNTVDISQRRMLLHSLRCTPALSFPRSSTQSLPSSS